MDIPPIAGIILIVVYIIVMILIVVLDENPFKRCKEIATIDVKGNRVVVFRCRNKLFSFQKTKARTAKEWLEEHTRRIEYEE